MMSSRKKESMMKEENLGNQSNIPGSFSVPPKSAERNRRRRLRKAAQSEEIGLSRSDGCFLYAFVSRHFVGGYILYRIDALEYLHSREISSSNENLLPLLIFEEGNWLDNGKPLTDDDLPYGFCALAHTRLNLYFVGEAPHQVYKLPKHKLNKLSPHKTNRGLKLLTQIEPMQGPKRKPLVFVANDHLYVISVDDSSESHEFETYSEEGFWKDLNPKPKGHGSLKSHLVMNNTVYFATTHQTVLSFDLANQHWNIVSTVPQKPCTVYHLRPAFDAPIFTLGNMIIGAFYSDHHFTVSASPYSHCDASVKESFLRPTLAPDDNFWEELDRRFDYVYLDEYQTAHCMAPLNTSEDQNILCILSYGRPSVNHHTSTWHPSPTYAVLTFFEILDGQQEAFVRLDDDNYGKFVPDERASYYAHQLEGDRERTSYFKSRFIHRKVLTIQNVQHSTLGSLITCFFF